MHLASTRQRCCGLALGAALLWGAAAAAWAQPSLPAPAPAPARDIKVEGHVFAATQAAAPQALRLVGAGAYTRFGIKAYAAALYLPEAVANANAAVVLPGPKRVQLRLLRELPANELSKALAKGVSRNQAPSHTVANAEGMALLTQAINAVGTARKGDTVDLDFDPVQGTLLRVNGSPRGAPIPGTALYAAILMSFVGERPYSPELRSAMLGNSP